MPEFDLFGTEITPYLPFEPTRYHQNPLAKRDEHYRQQRYDGDQKVKHPLMLLSGGLDSTFMLDQFTKHHDNRVDVVHAFLGNNSWKNECESNAINNIINHLNDRWYEQDNARNNIGVEMTRGDNNFSHSRICNLYNVDVGTTQQKFGFSQMGRWMVALMNNVDPRIHDKVMMGYVAGDQAVASTPELTNAWHYLWNAVMLGEPLVPLHFPLVHITKQRILDEMHPDLVKLTWTCETPKWHEKEGYSSCGTCPGCERSIMEKHMHKVMQRRRRMAVRIKDDEVEKSKTDWTKTLDRISKMDNTPIKPPEQFENGVVAKASDDSDEDACFQARRDVEELDDGPTDRRDLVQWQNVQSTGAAYDPHAR